MKKFFFKVGFIGSGNTAKKHAEVICSFKNYSITSVFSKNLQNAKHFSKKFKVKNFYNDFSKFKTEDNYDLINGHLNFHK